MAIVQVQTAQPFNFRLCDLGSNIALYLLIKHSCLLVSCPHLQWNKTNSQHVYKKLNLLPQEIDRGGVDKQCHISMIVSLYISQITTHDDDN